jgi:16S rRNA (guanine527-N7)-methyltransferase
VERGLIGPREAPRIWDRHLLNCAVLGELVPSGVYVVDVGSGAGLPGIVLAVARPDLRISLVESLARRTAFLTEVVEELGLSSVEVVRARAEECVNVLEPADVVTARAVAPLDRLASWCLPLARPGGVLLAIKGSSAADEIEEHRAAVRRLGGGSPSLVQCGTRLLPEPTTVVEIRNTGTATGSVRSRGGSGTDTGAGSRSGSRAGSRGGSSRGGSSHGGSSRGGSRAEARAEARGGSPAGARGDTRAGARGDSRAQARDDAHAARGEARVEKKPAGGRAGGQARSAGAGRSGGRGAQEARDARGTHGGARSGDGGDHPRK